ITGTTDEKEAAEILFEKGVKVFVYTMGKNGAKLFTPDFSVYSEGFSIKAIDTTGAGDSFLGGFLGKLMLDGQSIYNIKSDYAKTLLQFSNACGAIVSSRKGAIGSMPDKKEVEKFLREHNC
ncbi:MAG: PfkB family carbohydrate kinase, partial [Spirochaetales bacterium]|nr:PfkB family carbohydrate kinase [Spirochaetales bacterium]